MIDSFDNCRDCLKFEYELNKVKEIYPDPYEQAYEMDRFCDECSKTCSDFMDSEFKH